MQTSVSERLPVFEASSGKKPPSPRFSRKELDQETGFYYYGARYLNPKTSMWISADPAMGDYIPSAPVDEEARKRNGNLPGMGGVFNYVNFHVYHYAGNNPIKFIDPNGEYEIDLENSTIKSNLNDINDMKKANILYLNKFSSFKSIAVDENTGISVTFNSPKDMRNFVANNYDGVDTSSLNNFIKSFGDVVSATYLISYTADSVSPATNLLKKAGTGFSAAAILIDAKNFKDNPSFDSAFDVIVSGLGTFGGPKGVAISLGLSYTKKSIELGIQGAHFMANEIVRVELGFPKQILENMYTK